MSEKILTGDKYSFYEPSDENILGTGGNGKVYHITLIGDPSKKKYAVKFFHYMEEKKDSNIILRYKRFRQETEFLEKYNGTINGIIPIKDKHIPEKYSDQDKAWFIMPMATKYYYTNRSFEQKLMDLIDLAKTLIELHQKGLAHRDIKPQNLLIYQNRIFLCDFGLLWGFSKEKLTNEPDRIGPYKILPPELAPVDPGRDIDYTFSDVYLFAKNTWIILTEKSEGFMGPYLRNRAICYLQKDEFGVQSLEPIHQLLEKSTDDEIAQRITMSQCMDLLEQQLNIVRQQGNSGPLAQEKIQYYLYQEETKQVIAQNKSNAKEYTEEGPITAMLDVLINKSIKHLQSVGQIEPIPISISAYKPLSEKEYILQCIYGSQILESYHIYVEKMIYNQSSGEVRLFLANTKETIGNELSLSEKFRFKNQKAKDSPVYKLTKNEIIIFQHP